MKSIKVEDFNLTPEEMALMVRVSQRLLVPDDAPDRTPDSAPGEKGPLGGKRISRAEAEKGMATPEEAAATRKEFSQTPEEKLQEWARWDTLTSSEKGWTGQNEPMDGDAKTYLVRHGSTKLNNGDPEKDIIRGHKDIPLSDKGRTEAANAADELSGSGIKTIYTPDLSRAEDTAKALAKTTGAKVVVDPELRPWKFGPSIEGKVTADMLPKIKDLVDSPDTVPPGGESFDDFKDRYLTAFHKIQDSLNGENVAIIGHYRVFKLLEAWRATGVTNDRVDPDVFSEFDADTKPGDWEVLDKTGKLIDSGDKTPKS